MLIRRLRVEEGFFDGLDLSFSDGLNVLIGGRGVGKTSIIELLRFGLSVPGLTSSSDEDSLTHALAVLKSGQVTIDLEIDGKEFSVTRSANEDTPRSPHPYPKPIIFSQKEIESVGLDSFGRLGLIDSFISANQVFKDLIDFNETTIKSTSNAIMNLHKEIEELSDKFSELISLKNKEKELLKQQKIFASEDKKIKELQDKLSDLQKHLSKYTVDLENIINFKEALQQWKRHLIELELPSIPKITNSQIESSFEKIHVEIKKDANTIKNISERCDKYIEGAELIISSVKSDNLPIEESARALRGQIEKFKEGAGQVSREVGKVREKIARAENFKNIKLKKDADLKKLISDCNKQLEDVSSLKKKLFDQRKETIILLNNALSPNIQTDIHHLARLNSYEDAIKNTLRGSGLKYNEIAFLIASKVSPQELLLLSQNSEFQEFADILDIPNDRAARLLGYLNETDLGNILTVNIEDDIQFLLLDGASSKTLDELSIGQRCTVALSVVLENDSKVLLVDQPEDHLDNEFVADTLIRALIQRSNKAQTIISSHNANIPVLGNANRVIVLDSNGRKGYVQFLGIVDAKEIVSSIETIMEGGKKAFSERAKYYHST